MTSRRFLASYGTPVLSFTLAVLLWFYVVGQKELEWPANISVEVKVAATDLAGVATPHHVAVLLKGSRRILERISNKEMAVNLALAENQPGQYSRNISPSMVTGLPSGVQILRIDPAEVLVEIRPVLEMPSRVVARLSIHDSAFAVAGNIEIEPKTVDVRGMREILTGLGHVHTDTLLVTGPSGRKTVVLAVIVPSGAEAIPSVVKVTYEVVPASDSAARTLPDQP